MYLFGHPRLLSVRSLIIPLKKIIKCFSYKLDTNFPAAPQVAYRITNSQIVVLVPLRVQRVLHSVRRVALPRSIHNDLCKGVRES